MTIKIIINIKDKEDINYIDVFGNNMNLNNYLDQEIEREFKSDESINDEAINDDLFNVDGVLPQEVNDDWWKFLDVPTPISENRKRPFIGINTIHSHSHHLNYEIKDIPNPTIKLSPWLRSSIELDASIKPLF